jgi:hypothetical protein
MTAISRLRLPRLGAIALLALLRVADVAGQQFHSGHPGARPPGWFAAGSHPAEYLMVLDSAVQRAGKPTARLGSTAWKPSGFGTLMQIISAEPYRGKRVRFSGDVRVRDVSDWASLWMRVDGPCGHPRAFDNAQGRAARNTSDWRRFEIVLDVAPDADGIYFGTLLSGAGTVWAGALSFDVVPTTVPVTAPSLGNDKACGPRAPVNLDFNQR